MSPTSNPKMSIHSIMKTLLREGYTKTVPLAILRVAIMVNTDVVLEKSINNVIKMLETMGYIKQTGTIGIWEIVSRS